jgi:hypothetical protein
MTYLSKGVMMDEIKDKVDAMDTNEARRTFSLLVEKLRPIEIADTIILIRLPSDIKEIEEHLKVNG